MKTIEQFLSYIESLNVKLWAKGEQLHYSAPKGTITSNLLAQIREYKAEILQVICEDDLIRPIQRDQPLALSFAQQRLWLVEQLQPDSFTYNEPVALHLIGSLNVEVLEQSINEIVRRHEILRTTFTAIEGQPVQVISSTLKVKVSVIDLINLPEIEREHKAQILARQEAELPFDLAKLPLIRVTVLQLGKQENILLLTVHHIVWDGWSIGVLIQELSTLYRAFCNAQPSPLPELPIQYADFAVWQRNWLQGKVLSEKLAYWQERLGNNLPVLQLPTMRPRTEVKTNRGASQSFLIPSNLAQTIQAFSHQEGVSLFMTLLAGFQVLLLQYTKQEDIVVGTDIANRNRAETESLIGFFMNLLVLRTDLSGNPSFRELLARVRQVTLEAYAHPDLPFEELVKALQPERNLSNTSPLFQVLFVLQNTPMPSLDLPGLTLKEWFWRNDTARFELAIFLTKTPQGINCTWRYNSELFAENAIARMASNFETLLDNIVKQPNARINTLEILTEAEKEQQAMQNNKRKAFNHQKFLKLAPVGINLSSKNLIQTCYLQEGKTFPLVIQPLAEEVDLVDWAKSNCEFIENQLLKHGAILFRGFQADSVTEFENFAAAICPNLFGDYGDLPRAGVGNKVYGSTPYPADKAILFHNESSHLHCWPLKIWFFCVQPAQQGGETPIIDCRKAYQILPAKLREKLAQKQLMYVRNYTNNLDVSWQDFFRTSDKSVVEDYCRQAGISFEWYGDDGLITRQVRPALAVHPKTGESIFFNQIQLHHIAYLDVKTRESLLSLFDEKKLPRNVYYVDGTSIEDDVIAEINQVYQQSQTSFSWLKGDILMLDNMLSAHGRSPYVGQRKIVVAMGEMIHSNNIAKPNMEEVYAN
ncbi:TauD/TfdA family dioxygenase [Nostoc sp. UCD121]|uniref:condensation domain-containing protein n=1 Tax=unclassified Nostoc TaxID=2593658 RepID=UPI001629394C|nr:MULTISPECIES: condensation domain-containing protein [unclassified Nostoc]MBC1221785.1 TauD/TfdA family dioxygenase [Nostoc sp. UCD120]MBC1274876.1 TauD/TfdA family dioxygenase [Nostoc sp. UCD121]MBC1293586.1 TauD/TfdA family dioxygenase [Nostoc sp. UCD122]